MPMGKKTKVWLDISEITDQLSNLLINKTSNNISNNKTMTYSMVKEDCDHIPTCDGNPKDFFVKSVQAVYDCL